MPISVKILFGMAILVAIFGNVLIYWRKLILSRKRLCRFNLFNWTIPRENRLMKKLIGETQNSEERNLYMRIQRLLTLTHIAFFTIFGLIAFVMFVTDS